MAATINDVEQRTLEDVVVHSREEAPKGNSEAFKIGTLVKVTEVIPIGPQTEVPKGGIGMVIKQDSEAAKYGLTYVKFRSNDGSETCMRLRACQIEEGDLPPSVKATNPQDEADRQRRVKRSFMAGDVKSLVDNHADEVIDLDKVAEHDEKSNGVDGDYIKSFVFGGLDGIVSTFALVAGLAGASSSLSTLLAVGIAKVLADGFSMGFGEFTSAAAELENALIIKEREEWELENYEEGEIKEMAALYIEKGVEKHDALTILTMLAKYKDLFIEHMMVMEHGMMLPDDSDVLQPLKQGFVCFSAFVLFGLVPLMGFLVLYAVDPEATDTGRVLGIAYALTVTTLFIMGVTKAKLTGSTKWLKSGGLMVINGSIAGGVAYLIGDILTGSF